MAFLSLRASVMTSFLPSHDSQPPPAESVTSGTKVHDPRCGDPFAPFSGLAGEGRPGFGVGSRQPQDAPGSKRRQGERQTTPQSTQRTQRGQDATAYQGMLEQDSRVLASGATAVFLKAWLPMASVLSVPLWRR